MSYTKTNARIQLKYDTTASWKAIGDDFAPRTGELIIYAAEPDEGYPYPRFKVGAQNQTLNDLPFTNYIFLKGQLSGDAFADSDSGINLSYNTDCLFLDVDTNILYYKNDNKFIPITFNIQSDWSATEGAAAILNKPTIPSTPEDIGALSATDSTVVKLENGLIPSSILPSYVDDVIEVTSIDAIEVGENGKIYIDKNTNKTYRWSGTQFVEISSSLALGTTSSTAFQGDLGKTAYDHATATIGAAAYEIGMYKIETNEQGHVVGAQEIDKADIVDLGIPAQDTTYSIFNTSDNGLVPVSDGSQDKYLAANGEWKTINVPEINYPVTSVNGQTGNIQLTAEDVGALPESTSLFSGNYSDLSDAPTLATVATSGSYNDLTDRPNSAEIITGGSFGGAVQANASAMANLDTAQLRDVVIVSTDPGEGVDTGYSAGTLVIYA